MPHLTSLLAPLSSLPIALGAISSPSDKNYSFRIVTPTDTLRLDPGSKDAHDQWQEGLTMAIAASSLH